MIRKILLVVLLLCVCSPPVAADLPLLSNTTDLAAGAFANGIDLFLTKTADSIMDFATNPVEMPGKEDGERIQQSIVDRIIRFASWTIMPFEYFSVQQMLGVSFAVGVFILLMYNALGAAYCNLSRFSPAGKTFFHIMDGNGTTPVLTDYSQNTVAGCVAMSFAPFMVYMTLMFSHGLKLMAMTSIATIISPVDAIPSLYCAMAIMWLLLSAFFGVANVVIMITGAAAFLMGALYVSDRTRHVSVGWFEYFFGCAMMQPAVVCGVAAVVAVMTEIATKYSVLWDVAGMATPMYIATIWAATWLAYRLTVGKTKLLKSTSKLVYKVI